MGKKVKSWLALLALVLSSLLIGGLATGFYIQHQVYRLVENGPASALSLIMNRLDAKLDLSASQTQAIEPLLREAIENNLEIRREVAPRIIDSTKLHVAKIRETLDAEQQVEFDELFDYYIRQRIWRAQGFTQESQT